MGRFFCPPGRSNLGWGQLAYLNPGENGEWHPALLHRYRHRSPMATVFGVPLAHVRCTQPRYSEMMSPPCNACRVTGTSPVRYGRQDRSGVRCEAIEYGALIGVPNFPRTVAAISAAGSPMAKAFWVAGSPMVRHHRSSKTWGLIDRGEDRSKAMSRRSHSIGDGGRCAVIGPSHPR